MAAFPRHLENQLSDREPKGLCDTGRESQSESTVHQVVWTLGLVIPATWAAEAGGSHIQKHLGLLGEFMDSLTTIVRPVSK